jgi:hypothetical protein
MSKKATAAPSSPGAGIAARPVQYRPKGIIKIIVARGRSILRDRGTMPSFIGIAITSVEIMGVAPSARSFPSRRARSSAFFIGPQSLPDKMTASVRSNAAMA